MPKQQTSNEQKAFIKITELIGEMSFGAHGKINEEHRLIYKRISDTLMKESDFAPYEHLLQKVRKLERKQGLLIDLCNDTYGSLCDVNHFKKTGDIEKLGELIFKLADDTADRFIKRLNSILNEK